MGRRGEGTAPSASGERALAGQESTHARPRNFNKNGKFQPVACDTQQQSDTKNLVMFLLPVLITDFDLAARNENAFCDAVRLLRRPNDAASRLP